MNPSSLEILLQEGEGTLLEYKESLRCSAATVSSGGRAPSTQKLSRTEIRDFFRREGGVRFDLSLCPTFRYPRDFDRSKLDAWLDLSRITVRQPVEDILVNIEAAERSGGKLLFRHAGVLFFAREPRRFFNQAYITCILFKGSDRVHILDRKDFDGGIVSDIEESLRFIERNTRTAYRIERLQREEIPEYPMAALREALTNAVMHRDWFNEGANVFVEIYEDRIEIVSPGGLPAGLAASELGSRSVRRNALIADLLHRIAFIEKAGTGIRRMREETQRHGSPAPNFTADGFFTTTFRPLGTRSSEATGQVTGQVTGQATGQAAGQVTGEVVRLIHVLAQGPMTRAEAQTQLGLTSLANFRDRYLRPGLAAELIEMTIPEKPNSSKQRYRITPLGRQVLAKS